MLNIIFSFFILVIWECLTSEASSNWASKQPNFVIFLADDVGYGDLASYGHPTQEAGAIDQMAVEGMRFTQWYTADPVCTPSRGALLTGRQPIRLGLYGHLKVLRTGHSGGLPHAEITIAEALKDVGYTTGIVGKWHLGINEGQYNDGRFLPHSQGFDYVGTILPHTLVWACDNIQRHLTRPSRKDCFLYRNDTIVEQPINLETLTSTLVQDAKSFLYDNVNQPFFLYVGLPQCHTPMFNNRQFNSSSRRGVYGDQVNEMSWFVGEVMDTIRSLNLEQDTLAMFLSDNGPHREICEEGGHPGPFREGKFNYMEGGVRVPSIAWWPGTIPAGSISTDVINSMDIFPTYLHLAGATLPTDRIVDGRSFAPLLLNSPRLHSSSSESENIQYFYCGGRLMAARYANYKVYFRKSKFGSIEYHKTLCRGGFPLENYIVMECPTELLDPWHVYDIVRDPSEEWLLPMTSLVDDIVNKIRELVEEHKKTLWDRRDPIITSDYVHSFLSPCCNPPYCTCKYRLK